MQAKLTGLRRLLSYPFLDICKQNGALNKYFSFLIVRFY